MIFSARVDGRAGLTTVTLDESTTLTSYSAFPNLLLLIFFIFFIALLTIYADFSLMRKKGVSCTIHPISSNETSVGAMPNIHKINLQFFK